MRRVVCIALLDRSVEKGAFVRIAEAVLAFGPAASFDEPRRVVWVETGGCAHLHGGEREMLRALEARVRALGHGCRAAIADGPRIAAAVARYAPSAIVVPQGQGAAAVRALPVAALDLDPDVLQWLSDMGLATCGDLQKLPWRALGLRLGARVHDVLQMLDGEDRAPLSAWRPPPVPEERVDLEWDAPSIDALAFVLKSLCDRLAARLEGRAMSAARLELVLGLDKALCAPGCPVSLVLEVVLPSPIARAGDLLAVLRVRLERETLSAPVLSVVLRAPSLAATAPRTLDLLTPEPRAVRALPRLVAELAAEVGPSNVGTLRLVDTWVPDERTRLAPFGAPRSDAKRGRSLVTPALEPSRLVPPFPVPPDALCEAELIARVESVEWWRRGFERRDVVAAWMREEHALAWVEKVSRRGERSARVIVRGWID